MVVAPRNPTRRERRAMRPPADRPSVWPLILLLAGLAVLAGILAAVFAFTDSGGRISSLVHQDKTTTAANAAPVQLRGIDAYDPYGDQTEHDSVAGNATDGNPGTYWNTEHYSGGLNKRGVGLVLDAGTSKQLTQVSVQSGTPGFTALIQAGSSPGGPFAAVSSPQTVNTSSTFRLNGKSARYYVVWITNLGPNSSVEIDEVTAMGR